MEFIPMGNERNKDQELLRVSNLKTYFHTFEGLGKAVDGVDFEVGKGATLGIVGESGCGKSVTALSILRLIQPPGKVESGEIRFGGVDLLKISDSEMREVRGNGISMIFYERFSELSLLFLVGALFLFASADESIVIMLEATLIILLVLVAVYWRADFVLERLKRLLVRLPFTTPEICGDLQIRKLSVAPLAGVFAITLASLTLEFVRLWVVVRALGYSLSLLDTAVFLSIAVIAGLVSQIPLGIGVMEGSLDYLFRSAGLDPAGSMAIVLTDRVISMYFALVLGFIVSKFAFDEMEHGAP